MNDAQFAADAKVRVQDDAEVAVLEAMRDHDGQRFIVTKRGTKRSDLPHDAQEKRFGRKLQIS